MSCASIASRSDLNHSKEPKSRLLHISIHTQKEFMDADKLPNPEEVNFGKACFLLWIICTIPNAFQDGCKRCNTDACTNQNRALEVKNILRSTSKWPINVNYHHMLVLGSPAGVASSHIPRGRTLLRAGSTSSRVLESTPMTLDSLAFLFSSFPFLSKLQPNVFPKALVKSPTQRICTEI